MNRRAILVATLICSIASITTTAQLLTTIGREVAVATHLQDGHEFSIPLPALLADGRRLFEATWTDQEGGGRPLSKGTGRPLADTSKPLTGARAFNRVSGPDATSCAGCHNLPYGIAAGGGDVVTNVSVLGQRFDFATFDRRYAANPWGH